MSELNMPKDIADKLTSFNRSIKEIPQDNDVFPLVITLNSLRNISTQVIYTIIK